MSAKREESGLSSLALAGITSEKATPPQNANGTRAIRGTCGTSGGIRNSGCCGLSPMLRSASRRTQGTQKRSVRSEFGHNTMSSAMRGKWGHWRNPRAVRGQNRSLVAAPPTLLGGFAARPSWGCSPTKNDGKWGFGGKSGTQGNIGFWGKSGTQGNMGQGMSDHAKPTRREKRLWDIRGAREQEGLP